MTKRRIKEDSSSSEPVVPQQPKIESLTTPTQNKKIKIEQEEIVDLTGDPEFIDSAEGYDPDWKSSKPASQMSAPCKSSYPKPGKYMRPTKHLGATSKPTGSATSSSAASAASSEESYTYGKKRGRGFLLPEESSESEDSSEEED